LLLHAQFDIIRFMAKDWTKIQKKYKGQWVALDKDEVTVISAAKKLKEALAKAHNKGFKEPIMTRMPEEIVTFVGGNI
jgi:hypothetical protein